MQGEEEAVGNPEDTVSSQGDRGDRGGQRQDTKCRLDPVSGFAQRKLSLAPPFKEAAEQPRATKPGEGIERMVDLQAPTHVPREILQEIKAEAPEASGHAPNKPKVGADGRRLFVAGENPASEKTAGPKPGQNRQGCRGTDPKRGSTRHTGRHEPERGIFILAPGKACTTRDQTKSTGRSKRQDDAMVVRFAEFEGAYHTRRG